MCLKGHRIESALIRSDFAALEWCSQFFDLYNLGGVCRKNSRRECCESGANDPQTRQPTLPRAACRQSPLLCGNILRALSRHCPASAYFPLLRLRSHPRTHARTRACMFDKILIMHALLHPVLAEARFFLHACARSLTCQCARAPDFRVAHSASAARVEPKMPSALARSHTQSHYVSVAALHRTSFRLSEHDLHALARVPGIGHDNWYASIFVCEHTEKKNRTKCSGCPENGRPP